MAGHSPWHNRMHKKAAVDSRRGKIFTQHARAITVAARQGGGDPVMNSVLQMAIERAKGDNVPNDNIERAIKKGTGDVKDGSIIEEVVYEAYGPGGVALMILCLTDNSNRTLMNIRTTLMKHGGKMGVAGSVSYLFSRKGILELSVQPDQVEAAELAAIEVGAEDLHASSGGLTLLFSPDHLPEAKRVLHNWGVQKCRIELLPVEKVFVTDVEIARQIVGLIEFLEDDEDTQQVISNVHFSDDVLKSFG